MRRSSVRVAVGSPNGLTSNSWKVWATKHGDVYIACRDNFREAKVSLHASDRWRMRFTDEAVANNSHLLGEGQNRAWDVWDAPSGQLQNPVNAFQLVFPSSELAVRPEQRVSRKWADVIFVEAAPPGKRSTFIFSFSFRLCNTLALTLQHHFPFELSIRF